MTYSLFSKQNDLSSCSLKEQADFEFNKDYATVISDITAYRLDGARYLLDVHWSSYLKILELLEKGEEAHREEIKAILQRWHAVRESMKPVKDPEENRVYLWPRGKVPTSTKYTENTHFQYADDPEFEPYYLEVPYTAQQPQKGAVILASGGGHQYRSNVEEAYESALALTKLGYHCFIVNYRVNPFSDDESAIDMARCVKLIRQKAESYGFDSDKIAGAGFSYGGLVVSRAADRFGGRKNASLITKDYQPDETDEISADINAHLNIYSLIDNPVSSNPFPPTFFAFGADDTLIWERLWPQIVMLKDKGITVEVHTYAGVPHAFGAGTHADGHFYPAAATWCVCADEFMQHYMNH